MAVETHHVREWVLETAKDIDAKICAYAEKIPEMGASGAPNHNRLEAQMARIELIKAIMKD